VQALVLETLPGETLSHLLARRRRRRLAARDVAQLGAQLASALAYVHRSGFVHLDVKPSNVVCHGGLVKLLDFGLARRPGPVGRGVGTASYLAPEQARGGRVGAAADVFALGVVLYEAATGRCPFSARRRATDTPPPVATRRRLPVALARTIDACLERDPERRPAAGELLQVLGALAAPRPRVARSKS
jgi:serine/threonine protein kinase